MNPRLTIVYDIEKRGDGMVQWRRKGDESWHIATDLGDAIMTIHNDAIRSSAGFELRNTGKV